MENKPVEKNLNYSKKQMIDEYRLIVKKQSNLSTIQRDLIKKQVEKWIMQAEI